MAWTTPRLWTTAELVTASMMNTHVRDNLAYLKGSAGTITFDSNASFSGQITNLFSGGGTPGYTTAPLLVQAATGNVVGIGFHESGSTAATLYKTVGQEVPFRIRGNGGADYAVILDTTAQTMTNKTLTSPALTTPTLTDPKWTGTSGFHTSSNDLTNNMFFEGTGTVTLPAASGRAGQIRFIKAWAGTLTVNSGSTNLMGPGSVATVASSFVIAAGNSLTMICDGTYWWTV